MKSGIDEYDMNLVLFQQMFANCFVVQLMFYEDGNEPKRNLRERKERGGGRGGVALLHGKGRKIHLRLNENLTVREPRLGPWMDPPLRKTKLTQDMQMPE